MWRGRAEACCKCGDDIFLNPDAACLSSLISFVRGDWESGLGVKAVISFSILRRRSSIRSMASLSPAPAVAEVAVADAVVLVDVVVEFRAVLSDEVASDDDVIGRLEGDESDEATTDRFLRSELLTQSMPLLAQKLQGLLPSHFVLRRLHVSQAEPELKRRAVLVEKTLLG